MYTLSNNNTDLDKKLLTLAVWIMFELTASDCETLRSRGGSDKSAITAKQDEPNWQMKHQSVANFPFFTSHFSHTSQNEHKYGRKPENLTHLVVPQPVQHLVFSTTTPFQLSKTSPPTTITQWFNKAHNPTIPLSSPYSSNRINFNLATRTLFPKQPTIPSPPTIPLPPTRPKRPVYRSPSTSRKRDFRIFNIRGIRI